jgi:hypothetical protein
VRLGMVAGVARIAPDVRRELAMCVALTQSGYKRAVVGPPVLRGDLSKAANDFAIFRRVHALLRLALPG